MRDVAKAHPLARNIRAGSVCINCCRLEGYLNTNSVWMKTD
jgi:hypothetical protein